MSDRDVVIAVPAFVVNELSVDYVDYTFNPTSLFPDLPTFDYQDVIVFGGRDATRNIKQRTLTARNDLTWSGLELYGSHVFKFGVKWAGQEYEYVDQRNPQPRFFFRRDTRGTPNPGDDLDFTFPANALLGLGNPNVEDDNYQVGIYVQDDWEINANLTVNLGLRCGLLSLAVI